MGADKRGRMRQAALSFISSRGPQMYRILPFCSAKVRKFYTRQISGALFAFLVKKESPPHHHPPHTHKSPRRCPSVSTGSPLTKGYESFLDHCGAAREHALTPKVAKLTPFSYTIGSAMLQKGFHSFGLQSVRRSIFAQKRDEGVGGRSEGMRPIYQRIASESNTIPQALARRSAQGYNVNHVLR